MIITLAVRILQFFLLCLTALLIAFIWLPNNVAYHVSSEVLVQDNEGTFGYQERYYSMINQYLPFHVSPFATREVALTGRKDIGYTPYNVGDIGKTKLSYPGAFVPILFSVVIFYLMVIILRFLESFFVQKMSLSNCARKNP